MKAWLFFVIDLADNNADPFAKAGNINGVPMQGFPDLRELGVLEFFDIAKEEMDEIEQPNQQERVNWTKIDRMKQSDKISHI